MKPSKTNHQQGRLIEQRLSDQLNPKNELVILSDLIDWGALEDEFETMFVFETGAPAKPVRLIKRALISSAYAPSYQVNMAQERFSTTGQFTSPSGRRPLSLGRG